VLKVKIVVLTDAEIAGCRRRPRRHAGPPEVVPPSPLRAASRSLLRDTSCNPSRSRSENMRRSSRSSSGSPLSGFSRKRRHLKSGHTSPKQKKRRRTKSAVSTPILPLLPATHRTKAPKVCTARPSQRQSLESEEVVYSKSDNLVLDLSSLSYPQQEVSLDPVKTRWVPLRI
jgi:hypothetical protein